MKLKLRNAYERLARISWVVRAARLGRAGLVAGLASGLGVWCLSQYAVVARVHKVEVVGNVHASEVAVRHLADLHMGDPVLLLDLEHIVSGVARHPWIDEATVSRVFPGTVRIEVREHEDVLLLVDSSGLYRVNAKGEVFIRARSSEIDRPLLTGLDADLIDTHPELGRVVVLRSIDLLKTVDDAPFLSADDVSEVHFDRSLGFSLVLRNGSSIHLGFRDPAGQFDRLDALVAQGLDFSQPMRIDLDLDGMAIATPLRT